MSTRTLIIGAGAIGGVTAAHLARAGQDVVVLDANREHVRLMRSPGLRFAELGRESTVVINAVADPAELEGRFDFALITLKAPFLAAALTPLVESDRVETFVSLGNGLVQDLVERITGPGRLLIGTTEWGATNLGPGHLAQTTVAPFVIGEIDGESSDRIERLARVLSDAAEVRVSKRILGQVWSKLLLNSTFSGLGAVNGTTYGDVVADPLGERLAYGLWTEGYDVAQARGVDLDLVVDIDPARLVVRSDDDLPTASAALAQLMSSHAATKASMLQDLERGALTEVDVINGGVVSQAAQLGVPSPLNARVVELIHECEAGSRSPGHDTLAELGRTLPDRS